MGGYQPARRLVSEGNMRHALLGTFLLLPLMIGCTCPAPHSPPPPQAEVPTPVWDWGEKRLICQTMIAFQGAFFRRDGAACLAILTPDAQRRYRAPFRSGSIYKVSGKAGQDILNSSDSVRVDYIKPPRARAYYSIGQFPQNSQRGIGYTDLVKLNGHWRIAAPPLDLPLVQTQVQSR